MSHVTHAFPIRGKGGTRLCRVTRTVPVYVLVIHVGPQFFCAEGIHNMDDSYSVHTLSSVPLTLLTHTTFKETGQSP